MSIKEGVEHLESEVEALKLEVKRNNETTDRIEDTLYQYTVKWKDRLMLLEEKLDEFIDGKNEEIMNKVKGKSVFSEVDSKPNREIKAVDEVNEYYEKVILHLFPWKSVRVLTEDFSHFIGAGNNGSIYLGYWKSAQLNVVVKVFNLNNIDQFRSYSAEIGFLTEYTHEKFIGVLGTAAQQDEKLRAIIFRYAELGSVENHIGALDWEQILAIIKGVDLALQYLHEKGMVHRDIKPANILLTEDYSPRLADFGSTQLDKTAWHGMTPGYIDRELLEDNQAVVRPYHDLYSLGVTLMQLLANMKIPIWAPTQNQPAVHICDWAYDEWSKGNSIICDQLRQTGCNKIMEERIVKVCQLLTKKPSLNRPPLETIIEDIGEIEATYVKMKEEGEEKEKVEKGQKVVDGRKEKKGKKYIKVFKHLKNKISASRRKSSKWWTKL